MEYPSVPARKRRSHVFKHSFYTCEACYARFHVKTRRVRAVQASVHPWVCRACDAVNHLYGGPVVDVLPSRVQPCCWSWPVAPTTKARKK